MFNFDEMTEEEKAKMHQEVEKAWNDYDEADKLVKTLEEKIVGLDIPSLMVFGMVSFPRLQKTIKAKFDLIKEEAKNEKN